MPWRGNRTAVVCYAIGVNFGHGEGAGLEENNGVPCNFHSIALVEQPVVGWSGVNKNM
jgi:hypothetical protein